MTLLEARRRVNISPESSPELTQEQIKVGRTMELGRRLTRLVDPHGYLAEADEKIAGGALAVFASNHIHHFNMESMIRVIENLKNKPSETAFLIALTLIEGDQGETLQRFTQDSEWVLAKNNMYYLPVYRPGLDEKYLPEDLEKKEQRRRELEEKSRSNVLSLLLRVKEDIGVAVFPEATIEGGRKRPWREKPLPWDRRAGTQRVPYEFVPAVLRAARAKKRDVVVVPITMHQAYRLVEPGESKPTLYAKGVYALQKLGLPAHATSVIINKPLGFNNFEAMGIDLRDGERVDGAIMRSIVYPLPERDKGYYSSSVV